MGAIGNEGKNEHSAISRTAASRVHPTWSLFGRAKSRSIIAACILLLEN